MFRGSDLASHACFLAFSADVLESNMSQASCASKNAVLSEVTARHDTSTCTSVETARLPRVYRAAQFNETGHSPDSSINPTNSRFLWDHHHKDERNAQNRRNQTRVEFHFARLNIHNRRLRTSKYGLSESELLR